MTDEDEDHVDNIPKKPPKFITSLLYELPSKEAQNSTEQELKTSLPDQNAPWIAVHGAKSAVIVSDRTQVAIVDVVEAQETRNVDHKTIQTREKVQAMAFSACGEFIAIADAAGTLSLYKSNGTLLFGHRVVRDGGSDSVVSIKFATSEGITSSSDSQDLVVVTTSGMLLRLGDLRLGEFEQLLLEKPKDALSVILRNIRFERTNVGRLKENAQSCMLVHRFESEECMILGNHGTFFGVWKTSLLNQEGRNGIKKVLVCDPRPSCVEAMAFDENYSWLVVLSEGKLSWWNWCEMTELFEADISRVLSFVVLTVETIEEEEQESTSFLVVARAPGDGSSNASFELVRIEHSGQVNNVSACVLSRIEPMEFLGIRSVFMNTARFASIRDIGHPLALAACRTQRGISIVLLASDGDILAGEIDESFDSETGEITFDEDIVMIAESLLDIPIMSLMKKRTMENYQTKLNACTMRIGENDDESRVVLKHLLGVAASVREYTSSSPRSSSLLTSLLRWCDEISDLSYKWTTFQLLSTNDAEASRKTLGEKWHLFRTMRTVEMLEKYIKLGSMRAVRILWSRHVDDDTVRYIGKLLQYLPVSLSVSAYADWIQSEVIPTLIHRGEQAQPSESNPATETDNHPVLTQVALWLLERSEAAVAKNDLDTAIRICNLLEIDDGGDSMGVGNLCYEFRLQTSIRSSETGKNDNGERKEADAFKRIERLSRKLRHVKRLAVEHHFIISLPVFEGETPATIAMSMLDRVLDPELLKKEIDDHVRKYLRFCGVELDPVLHDYVTELAECIQAHQSAEEARALVLLDEICDANIRADATLALLRSVSPPYSQTLKTYANNCTQWKTERLEEIEEYVRLMDIQDMLSTYDIKQFDVADAKSASRLLSHILNAVSKPTAFTDAMLLVDAYSDLHCDRAAVRFTENLLSHSPTGEVLNEVSVRVAKAMDALAEVKKRKEPKSHISLYVSVMEEIAEFGVMLLEMEAEDLNDARKDESAELRSGIKQQSFILWMLKALVAAYVPELQNLLELKGTIANESITTYIQNPGYLLSDALLVDLQKISQIEADYRVLFSVSALRDPETCESKLKQLVRPEILFADYSDDPGSKRDSATSVSYARKGKGKKRVVSSSGQSTSVASKRQRVNQNAELEAMYSENGGLQQDDKRTRLIFDLNRFASAVGIDSKTCQALIAQSAAKNGAILQAVRSSRDLFSRRANSGVDRSILPSSAVEQHDDKSNFYASEALKKVAISLSLYTSSHVKEIYDVPLTRNQQLVPSQVARIQAPIYTLELLRYALCMCDKESFDETLILLKNTMLVNEILQFTQHNILATKTNGLQWTLYPRWYRGDACALASYEAMKLVTRFAIAEHKNLRREVEARDTIASKRCVSFLVEQRADLLSLQALMTMQELPEDASSVVNTQMGKLLSIIFQSQEVDNYLALGLMLSMKQEDAFHAFRKQISRENVAKEFNRFQHLACIGADAARAWQQIAFLHQCVEVEGNARWWHYLNLLGIECDHKAFQSERRDLQYIRRLVPTLLTRSNYDFYTVLEFTRHYQIEDGFPALVYTEALLLEESASTNLEYQDKIAGVIEEIHEQHLVKLLLKSIPKVSGQDYDRLLFVFRLLLENTSYSEREEVERRVEILRNLKAFDAFKAKDDSKQREKIGNQLLIGNGLVNEVGSTPEGDKAIDNSISFHELIADPQEVLAKLVTKDNFSSLIGLAEPLQLEPDELQMQLLKNMITTNLKGSAFRNGDNANMAQFSEFEDILRCLSDIENRVTAAEWLAENFPLGDEKLKALEFALTAALSGQNGSADPSNTSFTGHEAQTRLETKILRVKVEVLLQNSTSQTSSFVEVINDKEEMNQLLALVSEPQKLFLELYKRYALWFYTRSNDMLHTVACSIGNLLQLSQAKLRLELVGEWLVKDAVHISKGNSNQDTKENPFELLGEEKLQRADEDFGRRILYLATAGGKSSVKSGESFDEQVLTYLVEFAKDSRSRAGVTYRAKMRALCVILRLGQLYRSDVERFVTTKYGIVKSDQFFKELLEYAKHYTHMMTFEEHRVPYDLSFVLKTNKEVLTRSFLRRFPSNQTWVLRCASQLMLDFGVEASDLWEDVLTSMLQLGMIRSLITIMGPLSRKSFVRSLGCGRQVWEDVLTLPLVQLKHSINPAIQQGHHDTEHETKIFPFVGIPISNVRSVMEKMVTLLQKCPFLDQIDVPAFVVHFRDIIALVEEEPNGTDIIKQLDLYGFAVKCAMIIPKPVARFEALVRIVRAGAYGAVLHELQDTLCFLDGAQSENTMEYENGEFADNCRLIQESFSEAEKRKNYSAILGTPFERGFVEYLAATADIDYLLSLLLEDKRMEVASTAVELYYDYHPSAAPSLETTKPDDDEMKDNPSSKRWEVIDMYLTSSKSAHLARYRAS